MRFRIPANVDMPDRILAGLTARQLVILAGAGLVVWGLYALVGRRVPLAAYLALAIPLAATGVLVATARRSGMPFEILMATAVRHVLSPARRVLAPEGIPELSVPGRRRRPTLAALDLPINGVDPDGRLDLGKYGSAAICRASSVNFTLRSEAEQRALVDGLGRLANALDAPIQFLIRSEAAHLPTAVAELEDRAPGLPHPALEGAALDHARFLRSFSSRRDGLSRGVFLCLREPTALAPDDARSRLEHRASEVEALLRPVGIRLTRLEGREVVELLRGSASLAPPKDAALPSQVIRAGR
ncbi:MAG: PrgI family protein [Actinomycetota bacterium]